MQAFLEDEVPETGQQRRLGFEEVRFLGEGNWARREVRTVLITNESENQPHLTFVKEHLCIEDCSGASRETKLNKIVPYIPEIYF